MKRFLVCVALLSATGCASMAPKVTDPHAVAPRNVEWAATVAAPRADVYNLALRVLSDSAYGIARSDALSGLVDTRPRKESEGQSGAAQTRTKILGADWPVILHVLLSPTAGDSTRVSIRGEYLTEGSSTPDRRTTIEAYQGEWKFIRGIGEAILARTPARP